MSETGLNFGPDWLRELSDNNFSKDGNNKFDTQYVYLSKPVKYKYEKKEILDLFDSEVKIQPKMKEFTALISDRCQTPLSLKPMTEFEQQAFGKCVNSEFVSRLANKTINNKSEHNPINSNEVDLISERDRTNERTFKGRGVNTINFTRNTSDRGRGRIRTGLFRNSSYEAENEVFSNENRRDFRTKSFDRTEEPANRENKPFERQFSKPPPVCVDNNGNDNSRLNFRKDTHQNDTSWRSNRTRTDNTRKNLEWRSKFRPEESNSINSGDWKNNDRWRNENENEDNLEMNKKRMYIKSRDKNWDDNEDDKRNNLPEWSLNDDAVLDKKFGTFDASGQFREEPIDPKEFKMKDELKILKDNIDKQMNINEDKNYKNTNLQLSNCPDFMKDLKKNKPQLDIKEKEKINQNILDMLAENSQSKTSDFSSRHDFKTSSRLEKNCDLKSTEREDFQPNLISSLIQRHPSIFNHNSEKAIKPSNDLSIEQSQKNDQNFPHNFINNISSSQPQPYSQLSQFNKNQQDQDNTNKILDIINDRKSSQKINSQLKVSNDEIKELNLNDKNNVQSFLESLANSTKTNSQNFSLNNTDVQKILSLAETEKLLKEINKSNFNDLQKQQVSKNNQTQQESRNSVFKNIYEENFNDVEKCTDNLVDQWSVEEDSKERFFIDSLGQKFTIFPPNHEFGQRWFYKDPQGEVQGPFSSNDMLDWYKGGYFTMDLLVRRGCDEEFLKLGELINTCKGVPFTSNENPMPLRNITPQINPMLPNQAALFQMAANQNFGQPISQARNQPAMTQQQPMFPVMLDQQRAQEKLLIRQMQQRQMMMYDHQLMQNQLRHLLTELKKTEQFSNLPVHEQQEVLIQHYVQNQHRQMQRNPIQGNIPVIPNMSQSSILNQQTPIVNQQTSNVNPQSSIVNPQVSIVNPQASIVNQQASIVNQQATNQPQNKSQHLPEENLNQMLNSMNQLSMNPIMKQMMPKNDSNIWIVNGEPVMTVTAIEEMQRQEQERRDFEEKQLKLIEEQEQRRKLKEMQLKIEEERKRNEEIIRKQEEESRKQEIERMKLEQAKNEEKFMQDKLKKLEEQKRRQDEEMKKKNKEEKEIMKKQLKQKQHQQQMLIKQQEKNDQQKQQQDKHEQQMLHHKEKQEQQKQQSKKKGWAVVQESNFPASLDEIQKLQEIELEERMKNHQLIQMLQESQNPKGWSNVTTKVNPVSSFLTLDEIQKEESERLARKKKVEKENIQVISPQTTGVWGNAANNLNWKTANLNIWGNQNQSKNDFVDMNENLSNDQPSPWSIELNGTHSNKKSSNENIVKNSEKNENSAFSLNSNNNNTTGNKENNTNGKKKNVKKEENSVLNTNSLNKNNKNSKATIADEFNKWCHEALSQFQASIDVPTFISFLKDVESPHDVNDYVFSYLGENKDSKEFSKRFIEKRSYYKNQAKKTTSEEVIWSPAPAITPSLNKVNSKVEENEFSIFKSGKRKKKTVKKTENSEEVK